MDDVVKDKRIEELEQENKKLRVEIQKLKQNKKPSKKEPVNVNNILKEQREKMKDLW